MAEWWEWSGEPGPWESNAAPDLWAGGSPTFNEGGGGDYFNSPAYQNFTGWGDPSGPGTSGDSSGGWLSSLLSGGGQALSSLFGQGGAGGPLLSALGSLGGGAIGSNAANEAARLQSQALNRGIDLQTAQWLQQQGNLAPYLQAGQGGLAQLQQLAGREAPSMASSYPTQVNRQWYDYGVPSATPGWQPQTYAGPQGPNAGDYRWNPQQGPQAANYRYAPGQTPDASQYASGPPQLYQGAMPGTQVPTLSGQELLAQDPGAAFRQTEARRALEASAAARGGLLSGGTLQALQSRSQDLASQEYQSAWQRMMARNTEQYGRDWGQYQQNWQQGVQGTQLGLQTNAQNFAQAEAAARLREQVNQIASQQGWSQAQAESVFREQQAQLASQQGWNQALQGQQNAFTQGLDTSKWNTLQQQQYAQEQYKNMLTNNQLMYGRDVAENQTNYEREQARYRQQLAQYMMPWEQASTLANLGGQATGMYGNQGQNATNSIANLLGQLGTAQGQGAAGSGLMWNRALTGAANQVPSLLASLNA